MISPPEPPRRFISAAPLSRPDTLPSPAAWPTPTSCFRRVTTPRANFAPRARWIDVGKRGFSSTSAPQTTIDALLVKLAAQYAVVVRLKGGDASVFGRLEEELLALAGAGIECEVVPGVTAALAAAAEARRPLTRRGAGRSVSLTTAMTRTGALQAGRHADTESSTWPAPAARTGPRFAASRLAGRRGRSVSSRAPVARCASSDHLLVDLAVPPC